MRNLIFLALAAILLTACGDARSVPPGPPQSAGQHVSVLLSYLGSTAVWVGGAAVTLGAIAIGASYFVAFLMPFRRLLGDITAIGAVAILVGTADLWVASHTWVIWLALAAVACYLLARYHGWGFLAHLVVVAEEDVVKDEKLVVSALHHASTTSTASPIVVASPAIVVDPPAPK